jgi:hypothetical protein
MLVSSGISSWAVGREITVSPSPSGGPVVAAAIKSAEDGDTMRIKKGVYRETIVVDKRLQLVGEDGAILDPSQPLQARWEPAGDVGKGVYRTRLDRRPYALMLDGKILAEIDERRTATEGPWFWRTLLAKGTPKSGFRHVRAVWMYRQSEKTVYLHLADDAPPHDLRWSVVWSRDPVVTFRETSGASISGLTISHCYTGVALTGHCSQCTVSHCTIGPWERTGVTISQGAAGCLVEQNRIFRGAYEDWVPRGQKNLYEVWQIHKLAGFYDRVGIALVRAGADNRVHANHVWETFDGIDVGDASVESLDIPLHSPDDGRGTEIWENVIERTRDSGIELGVGCINVRVHHNTLRQTHGGLRFKLPRIGPVFIYRNLLVDGSPFNIWYSMDDSPAEGYVYHNTIIGGRAALLYSSFNKGGHGIGAPHWHYLNNLAVTGGGFFANNGVKSPVNFAADYNLVVGGGKPWSTETDQDRHSLYVDHVPLTADHRPLPDGPAIDAGLDLSKAYHGKPLPGCEPGYFQGKAPDIGAFEVR